MNSNPSEIPSYLILKEILELEFRNLENQVYFLIQDLKGKEIVRQDSLKSSLNSPEEELIALLNQFNVQYQLQCTPDLFIHSLFSSCYSFFEHSLKKLAELVAIDSAISKRKVLNFEKLHQYFSYLTNDIGLDRKAISEAWEMMNVFRDIRNSIIHHNSTIGKNISTRTYQFLKEDTRIEFVEPIGFKIKDEKLINELISTSKLILMHLIDQYGKRVNKSTGRL